MQAAAKMEQLPLAAVEPAKPDNERRPKAPPMVQVRRALGRALAYLYLLDRVDPGSSRALRRALYADAGLPLSDIERARLGNIFRASIFQRQALKMWWLPKERHITSRRTYELVEKRRRLPEGAIYIGSYEAPVHESLFLDDLDDLLKAIREGCDISGEPE